mgnify:FL=1
MSSLSTTKSGNKCENCESYIYNAITFNNRTLCTVCVDEHYSQWLYSINHTKTKRSKKSNSWFQRIFKKNRIYIANSEWKRDLTQEGIESNPGPNTIYNTIQAQWGVPIQHAYNKLIKRNSIDSDFICNLIESTLILFHDLSRADSKTSKTVAILSCIKSMKHEPLIKSVKIHLAQISDFLLDYSLQAEDTSLLEGMRDLLNKYDKIKDSSLFKKLYKCAMYALSMSIFSDMGITMDKLRFTRLQQEAIHKRYHSRIDFVHSIVDTIVFICERGQQYMRTGSMDSIFHDGSAYSAWMEKVFVLKRKAQFIANPEPHGFDKFSYLADLRDIIDQGQSMKKYASTLDDASKFHVNRALAEMELLLSDQISKRSSQKERQAPFAVCLAGGSSVAKSTLTQILFHHYGKLFKLPTDSEYMYTRNHVDDFWVNFNSTQWCVRMDDIAFMLPSSAPQGDPSMLEMLQVVNSVPFVPTQAALEDKGKTPMLARLVLATTNTPDLNAKYYFSCPLAIQRRLPFVIDVRPKEEYAKDKCMLDGSLVPEVEDGDYPDFWILTVKAVKPHKLNKGTINQKAEFQEIAQFDNIYDFLDWFSEEALKYSTIQDKETDCKTNMAQIKLCDICHRPIKHCKCSLQSDTEIENERITNLLARRAEIRYERGLDSIEEPQFKVNFIEKFKTFLLFFFFFLYYKIWPFRLFIIYYFGSFFHFKFLYNQMDTDVLKYIFKNIGNKVSTKIGIDTRYRNIVALSASALVMYKVGSTLLNIFTIKPEVQASPRAESGVPPKPSSKERDNVWYKDNYETTPFDTSEITKSMKGLDFTTVIGKLESNCVSVVVTNDLGNDKIRTMTTSGICIGGHIYMFNNHGIPILGDDTQLTMINYLHCEGINGNTTFKIVESQIKRYVEKDLCFIEINNIPPKKNIIPLFMQETLKGVHKGIYVTRERTGEITKRNVHNIQRRTFEISDLDIIGDLWMGVTEKPTNVGDCGSILVSQSAYGPIILGIHILGNNEKCGALAISNQFLKAVSATFVTPIIQSSEPLLDTPNISRPIGPVHYKSTARYIQNGCALVHASFEGFRPKHKSSVSKNILHDSLIKRGYTLNYGAPVMSGWEPWRRALLDMTNPVSNFDQRIVDSCVESFTKDILSSLTQEDLDMIHVYDDITAINGAPGVSYVDSINRSSSAGYPWKRSKKYYLHPIEPIQGLQDPIALDDEVMDRVKLCEEKYKRGERFMPVFSAHLKDEPTSFKKIKMKKTRVFTGAPIDYTIVVRKYYLSMIRVMQNNRFVFECGPGTIAQSLEWEEIYNYLTKFGKQRMVAGDYASFDKSMPANLMLAGFKILSNICKAAGYSEEEMRVLHCIAEDTCFPLIDFNGDLMTFYGTNPSGHPLTVILNGIVNSLYIRYCYSVLNPEKHCNDFKKNVSLMTYGDDNVMGISPKCSFMNHTTIQRVLADIGIKYTMADKETASIPFIHIDDVTFLKRSWRYDADIGAIVAPIEEDSIIKRLMINVASKTITPEAQAIETINSAIRDYFWCGKSVYNEKRQLFKELIKENNLEFYEKDTTLPEWIELKDEFWKNSEHVNLGFKLWN